MDHVTYQPEIQAGHITDECAMHSLLCHTNVSSIVSSAMLSLLRHVRMARQVGLRWVRQRTEGKGKYKFVTRLREPKLETPFKDRVVKKRKPLPTIFSLLPEKGERVQSLYWRSNSLAMSSSTRASISSFLEIPVAVWKANYPDRIISHAVRGMLPRNNLRDVRMARLKLVLAGQDNEHERLVQQTPQMKHISDAFFRASFREPLFDPAVHAGWYLKTVVDADGVSEIVPTRTEGKGKYKFVTRLREPKLETPFKDRVVKKRKPLPTIFSLLPEKVQKAALKK
ncbi:hypothetical protein PROFUN_07755 [Planoprotostelium fungivorum]|uniref:50S ribosomal protein L13 n=1 Tax=Planoprotostelium fungivorum TaxID=1890364 RepID=A0A2P6N1K3_9EUKA|nr:hypothetical protein PROFUN_07755 [Planoprotostelium fungivorum]